MRIFPIALVLATAGAVWADTVTLKNGRVVNGNYLGGSPRQVKIETGDQVQVFDIADVVRIEFSTSAAVSTSAEEPPRQMRRATILRPDPASAAPHTVRAQVELPAGSNLVIRMIDSVDSEVNRVGQTFQASLDEPVIINGEMVVPRGADAVVKLVDAKESGKLAGRTELTLDLVSVKVDGRMVDVNTQTVSQASSSRGERTAKVAGGTAVLGAIIGGIAGGGKGAAIGAGAGAAAGAGAQVITKGQRLKIPSETRLTFITDTPVRI